jgi:hypothetical protein
LPVSILDAGAAQLEIELANACVVRLKGADDPELLRVAIHAAGSAAMLEDTFRAGGAVECMNSVLRMQQSRHKRMT